MFEISNNVLLLIFILVSLVQISFSFIRFKISRLKISTKDNGPISLIICAKNEEVNLKKNLEKVLNQDFKEFEVIVVDDQSTDSTNYLLNFLSKKYSNLKVVTLNKNVNSRIGKKFALSIGIKTAKFDNLVLTDADCIPNSRKWLSLISSGFDNHDIVLGYSNYKKESGLLNKLVRFDTYLIASSYFTACQIGIPYMGVGRNLAYKKDLFFKNKGFANHINLISGDDDLFIQEVASKENTTILLDSDSHTSSLAEKNWKDWFSQKRRHYSTASRYKFKTKIYLIIDPLSTILFYLIPIYHVSMNRRLDVILLIFSMVFLIKSISNYKLMKKLKLLDLFYFTPFIEIFHLILIQFLYMYSTIRGKKSW